MRPLAIATWTILFLLACSSLGKTKNVGEYLTLKDFNVSRSGENDIVSFALKNTYKYSIIVTTELLSWRDGKEIIKCNDEQNGVVLISYFYGDDETLYGPNKDEVYRNVRIEPSEKQEYRVTVRKDQGCRQGNHKYVIKMIATRYFKSDNEQYSRDVLQKKEFVLGTMDAMKFVVDEIGTKVEEFEVRP